MTDHVRALLQNRGASRVKDEPSDRALALFGLGGTAIDDPRIDLLLPLALAPDLSWARDVFDGRTTPPAPKSVYRAQYELSDNAGHTVSLDLTGLYAEVLGQEGWWTVSPVFSHPDPLVQERLSDLRDAARSMDAQFALGAVLLACAYRRWLLGEGADR